MSKKKTDNTARNAGLGLAALVLTVIGVGVMRSRKAPACEVVEASVYRGFTYRIERCPIGDGEGFFASIPAQTVGAHSFTKALGEVLGNVDDARKWIQMTLDKHLGGTTEAFVFGATRV